LFASTSYIVLAEIRTRMCKTCTFPRRAFRLVFALLLQQTATIASEQRLPDANESVTHSQVGLALATPIALRSKPAMGCAVR
jgi:hypothetical protein